jgi:hypothetical protein
VNGRHGSVDCPGETDLEDPLLGHLDRERGHFGLHPHPELKVHQRIEQTSERGPQGYPPFHEEIS